MPIVIVLFFISGFAALVYELLWFRQLGFIFGNTVYAATTVVSAYMTGLALGAFLLGRFARRIRHSVRWFGVLECCIGLYAMLVPVLFGLLRLLYRWAFQHVTDSLYVLTPMRFVFAFACLLIPTTLMGGTLPLLSEALLRRRADFGRRLGWLYGVNTLGAVAGVLGAGFVLIPALGLRGTNAVAVASNLVIGCVALLVGRAAAQRAPEAEPESPAGATTIRPGFVLLAAALSGFMALGFEVLWFRALTLIFGSTTYSFSAMLACFLLGIAAGSLALGMLADRARNLMLLFAGAELGIGIFIWAAMHRFDLQPEFLLGRLAAYGVTWPVMVSSQFLTTLKFLLVPTALMGLAFTVAGKLVRGAFADPARAVAGVYTWNTAGCVLGSLLAGFVLLPAFGLEHSLELLCAAAVVLGGALALVSHATLPWRIGLSLLAAVSAVLMITRPVGWDPRLLSSGPHFGSTHYIENGKVVFRERLREIQVVFYREGVMTTVAVTKSLQETYSYLSGGKVEADSSPRSMMLQRIAGHLPMLIHPHPRKVLNIGLGAGVSLGALGSYPLDSLTVVEIESAAVDVARRFAPFNHDIVNRPGLHVVIGDGRNFLFTCTNRFDVITSDPFEPVHAGANHLYTLEHFRQARACLEPGGIMAQYVPLYELSSEDYRAIIRTFAQVFPDSVLFYTGDDTLILGFNGPVRINAASVTERFFRLPEVQQSLGELGFVRPATLIGMFVADLRTTPELLKPGPMNTDDRPRVEYSAPKSALRFTNFDNIQVLLDIFTALPDDLLAGLSEVDRQAMRAEHEALRRSLVAAVKRGEGDPTAYNELLEANRLAPQNPVLRNELVSLLLPQATASLRRGALQDASDKLHTILEWRPDDFWANYYYVILSMTAGQPVFARDQLQQAMTYYPESGLLISLRAKLKAAQNDAQGAMDDFRLATTLQPEQPGIWNEFARAADVFGETELAARARAEIKRIESETP